MSGIQTIIACTDFSPAGNRAVALAHDLCPAGATLLLAHAVEPPPMPNPMYAHYVPEVVWDAAARANVERETKGQLQALVPGGSSVTYETMVLFGNPARLIVDLAKTRNVNLIVLGNHGRAEITKFFIGSVADRVMRHAERPVLLVP